MTEPARHDLSLPQRMANEAKLLAFEQSWQHAGHDGQKPRVEDYLLDVSVEAQSSLLQDLIKVDVEHRCRIGDNPKVEVYLSRFPQLDAAAVQAIIAHNRANFPP